MAFPPRSPRRISKFCGTGFDSRLVMIELKDCKLPMHDYMACLENRAETRVVRAFWELAVTERD